MRALVGGLSASGAVSLKNMEWFTWKSEQLGRWPQGLLPRTKGNIKTLVKQLMDMRRNAMVAKSRYVAESLHVAIIVLK